MFYTVYRTTCLVNGKTYIGCHKTKNPDDSYLGSGVLFSKAVEKYGKENFKKEVLFIFDNAEEMLLKELELAVVDPEKTYNLDRGGQQGFGSMPLDRLREVSEIGHENFRKLKLENPLVCRELAKNMSSGIRRRFQEDPILLEKIRSIARKNQEKGVLASMAPSARENQKEAFRKSKHSQEERNSQFGTCWVTMGGKPFKIRSEELESYLILGAHRGRGASFREKMSKAIKGSNPKFDPSEALALFATGLYLSEVSRLLNFNPEVLKKRLLDQGVWNTEFSRKGRPPKNLSNGDDPAGSGALLERV